MIHNIPGHIFEFGVYKATSLIRFATFRNSLEKTILQNIKQKFRLVKIYKPNSSRKESKEIYLIAIGFNNLHKD